jgi:amino acid transporter
VSAIAPHTALARRSVGLREVIFQSVATMGPGSGIALVVPIGAAFAGGALPLSTAIALAGCVCIALCVGQLAAHLPSAGGFYTYAAHGLHERAGFLVGWTYAFIWTVAGPLNPLLFGGLVAGVLQAEWGWDFDTWWIVCALGLAALTLLVDWFGVRINTKVLLITGGIELAIFTLLSLAMIVDAGDRNTLSVFGTAFANVDGFTGMSGVFAGAVFVILAFIGFEACVPLAEEARDRHSITKAVLLTVFAGGGLYILSTYAAAVWFGPEGFARFPSSAGGSPWIDGVGRELLHGGWVIVLLTVANSSVASCIGISNVATRTVYAMGRVRLLPHVLARTHREHKSPHVASLFHFAVTVAVTLYLGLRYDPLTGAGLVGTIVTIGVILIYMIVALATFAYFARIRRQDFHWLRHLTVPLLAIAFFVPVFLNAAGIQAFDFVAPLASPLNAAGPVTAIWVGIGVALLVWLSLRHPQRIRDTRLVFVEEADELGVPEVRPLGAPEPA